MQMTPVDSQNDDFYSRILTAKPLQKATCYKPEEFNSVGHKPNVLLPFARELAVKTEESHRFATQVVEKVCFLKPLRLYTRNIPNTISQTS